MPEMYNAFERKNGESRKIRKSRFGFLYAHEFLTKALFRHSITSVR